MLDISWIAGLMRQNYDAVGFLPYQALHYYASTERYILQPDERGRNVGYLLHGKPTPGGILVVTQHVIDFDKRLQGYGQQAFETLVSRARSANCRAIRVACAADLPSNDFWRAMGLELVRIDHRANKRQRDVNVMVLDLWPRLFR